MIKKTNKRITITLSNNDIKRLEEILNKFQQYNIAKTKSKVISTLIYQMWRDI